MKRLIAICALVLFAGCASMQALPAEDQTLVVVNEATQSYKAVRSTYLTLIDTGQPETVAFLKDEVAPLLDRGRDILVIVRNSAAIYKSTQVKPDDLEDNLGKLNDIISDIVALIATLGG